MSDCAFEENSDTYQHRKPDYILPSVSNVPCFQCLQIKVFGIKLWNIVFILGSSLRLLSKKPPFLPNDKLFTGLDVIFQRLLLPYCLEIQCVSASASERLEWVTAVPGTGTNSQVWIHDKNIGRI
jgi:hypothetical protein